MAIKNFSSLTAHELRRMVDKNHPQLSIGRQCELLGLLKFILYYKPVPVTVEFLRIIVRIDAWYLEQPVSGSRRMVDYLDPAAIKLGRDWVPDTSCGAWGLNCPTMASGLISKFIQA